MRLKTISKFFSIVLVILLFSCNDNNIEIRRDKRKATTPAKKNLPAKKPKISLPKGYNFKPLFQNSASLKTSLLTTNSTTSTLDANSQIMSSSSETVTSHTQTKTVTTQTTISTETEEEEEEIPEKAGTPNEDIETPQQKLVQNSTNQTDDVIIELTQKKKSSNTERLRVVLFKEGITELDNSIINNSQEPTSTNISPRPPRRGSKIELEQPELLISDQIAIVNNSVEYPALFVLAPKWNSQPSWLEKMRSYGKSNRTLQSFLPPASYAQTIEDGLMLLKVDERIFGFIHGTNGMSLINRGMLVRDFGQVTTLNIIATDEKTRIKYMSKVSTGFNPAYTQISYAIGNNFDKLAINYQDQVTGLETLPTEDGKKSGYKGPNAIIHVSNTSTLEDYPKVCSDLLSLYNKLDYTKAFPNLVIQTPLESKNPLIKRLKNETLTRLQDPGSMWVLTLFNLRDITPGKETEISCYNLLLDKIEFKNNVTDELGTYSDLEEIVKVIKVKKIIKITSLNQIEKNLKIEIVDHHNKIIYCAPIYKFLEMDIELDGKDNMYTLRGGKWHETKTQQYQATKNAINEFLLTDTEGPNFDPVSVSQKTSEANTTNLPNKREVEKQYCKDLAKSNSCFLVMDCCLVKEDPLPEKYNLGNNIEPFDLVYYNPKDRSKMIYLIYLKDWTSSSTFDHLANQGVVPGHTLLKTNKGRRSIRKRYIEEGLVNFLDDLVKDKQDLNYYIKLVDDQKESVSGEWIKKILDKKFGVSQHKAESKENAELLVAWDENKKKETEGEAINNLANSLYDRITKKCHEEHRKQVQEYLKTGNLDLLQKKISIMYDLKREELEKLINLLKQEKSKIEQKILTILPSKNFNPENYTILYGFFHENTRPTLSDYLPSLSRYALKNAADLISKDRFNVKVKRILKTTNKDNNISPAIRRHLSTGRRNNRRNSTLSQVEATQSRPGEESGYTAATVDNSQLDIIDIASQINQFDDSEYNTEGESEFTGINNHDTKQLNASPIEVPNEEEEEEEEEDLLDLEKLDNLVVPSKPFVKEDLKIDNTSYRNHLDSHSHKEIYEIDGEYFTLQNVSGDGFDCFFNTVGLSRQEQSESLLSDKWRMDPFVRHCVSFDIISVVQDPLEQRNIPVTLKKAINYDLYTYQRSLLDEKESNRKKVSEDQESEKQESEKRDTNLVQLINKKDEQFKEDLKNKSKTLEAYKSFVKDFIGTGKMVGIINNIQDTGSYTTIDAIAYINNIAIKIYSPARDKYGKLVQGKVGFLHEFIPQSATTIIYLYHNENHFQRFVASIH